MVTSDDSTKGMNRPVGKAMQRILSAHKVVATIVGALVMVLMFIIVVERGGRFLFGKPLQGAVEISRVVLAWVLFGSLAYALVQGVHVRVTLFLTRFPQRPRLIAEAIIIALSLLFFSLAVYQGWGQFWDSFTQHETMAAPIWIPFWLAKLALPVGCFIIAAQLGIDLVANLRQLGGRS